MKNLKIIRNHVRNLENIIELANRNMDNGVTESNALNHLLENNNDLESDALVSLLFKGDNISFDAQERCFYLKDRNLFISTYTKCLSNIIKERLDRNIEHFSTKKLLKGKIGSLKGVVVPLINMRGAGIVSNGKNKNLGAYWVEDKEFFNREWDLSYEELGALSQKDILSYLVSKGVSIKDIESLRRIENLDDRLYAAGKVLHKSQFFNFGSMDLILLLYSEGVGKNHTKNLNKLLAKKYEASRYELSLLNQFRIESGNYFGNFSDAKAAYKELHYGKFDIRDSIMLPLTFDKLEKRWMGFLLGDGALPKNSDTAVKTIRLHGDSKDTMFYRTTVPSYAWHVHNYNNTAHFYKRNPYFDITSSAISSWFMNNIYPSLDDFIGDKNLMEGIVATMASFYSETEEMVIKSKKKQVMGFVYRSFLEMGYSPERTFPSNAEDSLNYTIRISHNDYDWLLSSFELLNPKHFWLKKPLT